MLRLIGFLIVAVAVVLGLFDWRLSGATPELFQFRDVSTVWFAYGRDSLAAFQEMVASDAPPWLRDTIVAPALRLPAAPTLLMIGLVFFLFGLRGSRKYR